MQQNKREGANSISFSGQKFVRGADGRRNVEEFHLIFPIGILQEFH
jgi:hypothetical protein